ncbi:hpt domain [Clostridium sp. CAG:632]|jgi:HPt (histidine-containing phosphotransfer) domain-containing protein|nr:hpt domain [Clostridium sp. CAG:632]
MTVRECYEQMGADFDNVLDRLGNEQMVQRFALKFLNDTSYQTLEETLKEKNVEQAFRAAHTLKGVCLNLGFDNLFTVSSELTERLRAGELDGTEELFEKVKEQYEITVKAIRGIQ